MGQACGCQLTDWKENEELFDQHSSLKRSASQRSGILSPQNPQKKLKPKMFQMERDFSLTLAVECVDGDSNLTPARKTITPLSKNSLHHQEILQINQEHELFLSKKDFRASSAQTNQSNSNVRFGNAGPRPIAKPFGSNRSLIKRKGYGTSASRGTV